MNEDAVVIINSLKVKSVQRGTSLMGNTLTLNVPITTVGDKCDLSFSTIGYDASNTSSPYTDCIGILNNDSIDFERNLKNGTGTSQVKISWQVIEYA